MICFFKVFKLETMCYNPFTSRSAQSQEKTKITTKTVKQKKQNKNKIKQLHSVKKLKNTY